MRTLLTNLIPFPRLHFMTVSHAPTTAEAVSPSTSELTDLVFDKSYATVDCNAFNEKFLSSALVYRGSPMSDIEEAVAKLKTREFPFSVSDCLKYGNIHKKPFVLKEGKLAPHESSCTLINHNVAVKSLFKRMKRQWDRLFSKRSFTHWYLWHGMNNRGMICGSLNGTN